MERIAFIGDNLFLYWRPIILALAALAAILFYIAIYLKRDGNVVALAASIPMAIFSGVIAARFVHWYCRTGAYTDFNSAMTDYTYGNFALVGVFFGCILSALVLRIFCISKSAGRMLDSMAIGGGIGIAVGRLASMFDNADRGMIIPEDSDFPFVYPLVNAVTGETENRLATFAVQSVVTIIIVSGLLLFMLISVIRKKKIRDGDIFLIFLSAYCASQVVCDSTRYDALVLRSNGFVSMVQIVGLIGLLIPIVLFSARLIVKNRGVKLWLIIIWIAMLALLGIAGWMEYIVQNNSTRAMMSYSVMSAAVGVVVCLTYIIRFIGERTRGFVGKFERPRVMHTN